MDIEFNHRKPPAGLTDFVASFWMLTNHSERMQPVVTLPDGRMDMLFYISNDGSYRVTLVGLDSEPSQNAIAPKAIIFGVSYKLLAVEYILSRTISPLLNKGDELPVGFRNITAADLHDLRLAVLKPLQTSPVYLPERKRMPADQPLFQPAVRHSLKKVLRNPSVQSFLSTPKKGKCFPEEFFKLRQKVFC